MITQKALILALSFMGISVFGQACSPKPQSESSPSNVSGIQLLLTGDYIGMTNNGEIYHSIVKLQVPKFGGDIYYHHISLESLGGPAFQRKIYAFDDSGSQMRSTVLIGLSGVFLDEDTMAQSLNSLAEETLLRFPDGCKFQWKSGADGFVAEVRREKCSYESPAFGGFVSPEMTYKLSRCSLAISEGIFREDDSPIFPSSTTINRRVNSNTDECHDTRQ